MPTDNMNFIERAIYNGFERYVSGIEKENGRYDVNYNTKNGWMGVVVYHPYECFTKGNKKIELSLERYGVTDEIVNDGTLTKVKVMEKHITASIDGAFIYHNKFGVMPSKEIEQKLFTDAD